MADPKAWNLWHGCNKYSDGCKFCYMYYLDEVRGVKEKSSVIKKTNDFDKPIKKDRHGNYKIPSGYTLRINMTSDTFLEETDEWRKEMWKMIKARPDVIFFILTKRVYRIKDNLPDDWNGGYENVDLNITIENQRAFDERWPIFKDIPAKHKGFNLAPILGPIDITPALESGQIEFVGLGGEGFGRHRATRYEWIKSISEQNKKYRVNFEFNSTGTVFIKDGRTYYIDSQPKTAEQAYLSGLSRFYQKPKYNLYSPYDGHLLSDDELMIPEFNKYRCIHCVSLENCIGCKNCGVCKKVEIVSKEEIYKLRNNNKTK